MTSTVTLNRHIRFEGCFNFRDLGGLQTASGDIVRQGRLFRSDAVHNLTESDMDSIRALQVATLLDLRSSVEINTGTPGLLREGGVRHVHVPLMDDVGVDQSDYRDIPMEHLYARMLDGDGMVRVFAAFAEPATYPAIIHCAAGKDRSGITIALLLRTLGVPDDAIIADYALTDACMTGMVAALRANLGDERIDQVPAHYLRAMPETMQAFLNIVDDRHGSAENYLHNVGITDAQLGAIRESLLEPRG